MFALAILALITWCLLPGDWRIKYAAEYWIDIEQITIEHKPHNCDWDSAPIGSKHCHYDAIVTVYNQYGHVIEGPGRDKTNPPNDQNEKIHVEWERVEE